jgi:hypothetical protein
MGNDIVPFELALMLTEEYDFRYTNHNKPHHIYTPEGELKEASDVYVERRSSRVWAGMKWKYQWYIAPTYTEAIEYLMGYIDTARWSSKHYDNPEAKIFALDEENKKLKQEIEDLKKQISI